MEIKKKIDGFTIEVSFDEYKTLKDSLDDAIIHWDRYGLDIGTKKYGSMLQDIKDANKRYLTAEESKQVVDCLVCKNCLPPFQRKGGRMCSMEKCQFNPA